jgi:hypothetical protein
MPVAPAATPLPFWAKACAAHELPVDLVVVVVLVVDLDGDGDVDTGDEP